MPFALRKTSHLIKDKGRIILYSDDDLLSAGICVLHPINAMAIGILDKCGNERGATSLLSQVLNISPAKSTKLVREILNKYRGYFCECRNHQRRQQYNIKEFITSSQPASNDFHLDYPLRLTWIPTWQCPQNCIFCAVTLPRQKGDGDRIPFHRLLQIFDEARQLGTTSITIHGGEPFIYQHLYEAIEFLRDSDFYIRISTRRQLSIEQAACLARLGVENVQVSVDSLEPETAKKLSGSPNLPQEVKQTIKLLREFGIAVTTNTVLTSLNIRQVPSLIKTLHTLGVSRVILSWYVRTFGGHRDWIFASQTDKDWLQEQMETITDELYNSVEIFYNPLDERRQAITQGRSFCSAGRFELVILPNGKVTICDRLAHDERFIVGDLRSRSLREVWNSSRLEEWVFPERQRYAGTRCFDCSEFEECSMKGRCYVRSLLICGKLYSPDYLCEVAGEPSIRVE